MSIKLVSWNVNGIRAVSKKEEFWDWFDNTDADIINFQEVRATQDKIPEKLADVEGFHQSFNEAEKKGYSGVGTYSKIEPLEVVNGLGVEELDSEGRVLRIKYPDFYLYNIYFPNSGMNAKRLDFKVDFCKVAEGFGVTAYRVTEKEEFEKVFQKALDDRKPAFIEVVIDDDDKVFPMCSPGAALKDTFDETDLRLKEGR